MKKTLALLLASVAVIAAVAAVATPRGVAAPPGPTIVDVAIAANSSGPYAGAFDTLIAAVLAADESVLATLSGNGQRTVFAPTDDAFAALGLNPGNIGTLPKATLTQILLYHVVNGRRDSTSVVGSRQLRTLQGGFLSQSSGVLTDALGRQATIIVTDVPAANGIIHAIDAVVLPAAP
jgi:uncharacterized surface protein with fasciclin (FAS1) repeats